MAFALYDSNGNQTGTIPGVNFGSSAGYYDVIGFPFGSRVVNPSSSAQGNSSNEAGQYVIDNSLALNKAAMDYQNQLNQHNAQVDREWQASEAQKARDWSAEQSNTAVRRRMTDLKEAGLNPLFALSNGFGEASTPAASIGSSSAANVGLSTPDIKQAAISSFISSLGTFITSAAKLFGR